MLLVFILYISGLRFFVQLLVCQMYQFRKVPLQFAVLREVKENEERKDNLKNAVRSVVDWFLMQKALFTEFIRRILFIILLNQKEFQRNIILKEPFEESVKYFEHCVFIHVTEKGLYQDGQILEFALIDAVNVTHSLEGLFDSLSSFLWSHALCC